MVKLESRISQRARDAEVSKSWSQSAHQHVFVARPADNKSADENIVAGKDPSPSGDVLQGRAGSRYTRFKGQTLSVGNSRGERDLGASGREFGNRATAIFGHKQIARGVKGKAGSVRKPRREGSLGSIGSEFGDRPRVWVGHKQIPGRSE